MLKLEIGPFTDHKGTATRIAQDWHTLSAVPDKNVDFIAKWGHEDLPFDDDRWDLIHAAHVLEHIDHWRVQYALKEAFRILKPGGALEIHVPDIRWLIQQWMTGQCDAWKGHDLIAYEDGKPVPGSWFNCRVLGFSESPYWDKPREHYRHRTLFDAEFLQWHLKKAGFVDIKPAGLPRGPEKHGASPNPAAVTLNLGRVGRKP